jgi:hypothetical protein
MVKPPVAAMAATAPAPFKTFLRSIGRFLLTEDADDWPNLPQDDNMPADAALQLLGRPVFSIKSVGVSGTTN